MNDIPNSGDIFISQFKGGYTKLKTEFAIYIYGFIGSLRITLSVIELINSSI